jgi:uncharacterized membrane protein
MDITKIINFRMENLEKSKRSIFIIITGILMSLLVVLYFYNQYSYGLSAIMLLIFLIIIVVTSIYLSLEYFKIVHEIQYNEFILQNLMEK